MPAIAATHVGKFVIGASDPIDRIYSGHDETLVLTIQCPSAAGGAMRVLLNGNPVPNGNIENTGLESRTFLLQGAKTVDFEWLKGADLIGQHTISVVLWTQ